MICTEIISAKLKKQAGVDSTPAQLSDGKNIPAILELIINLNVLYNLKVIKGFKNTIWSLHETGYLPPIASNHLLGAPTEGHCNL